MPWFEKSGGLKNRGFEKIGIPLYNAMFFQRLFLQSVLVYFTFNLPFLGSLGQLIHISHSHHKGFRLGKRSCIMSLGKFPLAGTNTDVLQLCIIQFQLRPSPPGQLRGICAPCQFRGWGISKFGTARGSGICLPRGDPRGFDTLVVSDSKSKHGGFWVYLGVRT